jgi:hypothetical protein
MESVSSDRLRSWIGGGARNWRRGEEGGEATVASPIDDYSR